MKDCKIFYTANPDNYHRNYALKLNRLIPTVYYGLRYRFFYQFNVFIILYSSQVSSVWHYSAQGFLLLFLYITKEEKKREPPPF